MCFHLRFFHKQESYKHIYTYTGIFSALSLSIIGAGIGIYCIATSLTMASITHPEIKSKNLISILFCEAIALYGIIMSIISFSSMPTQTTEMQYSMTGVKGPDVYDYTQLKAEVNNYKTAYGLGFGGMSVGFANLFAAVCVGILGSTVAISHANLSSLFVKLFISEVFAEAIALIGLICGIVMSLGSQFM